MWVKIFEIFFAKILQYFEQKVNINTRFFSIFLKFIFVILTFGIISLICFLSTILSINVYKSIRYDAAEKEVARKMSVSIVNCSNGLKHGAPNFMSWSRIEKVHDGYQLSFKEVLGDINGDGTVTDILRMGLNPTIYNTTHNLDNNTVTLFETLPELTPIGIIVANNEKLKILLKKNVTENLRTLKNSVVYDYDADFQYFEYNPSFFTKVIIPNLGLQRNTGYQNTKLEIIWVVITKKKDNLIYAMSWSFANINLCQYPNGNVAKTNQLVDLAKFAKENARETVLNLLQY